jgi:hypothetical protein
MKIISVIFSPIHAERPEGKGYIKYRKMCSENQFIDYLLILAARSTSSSEGVRQLLRSEIN